MSDLLQKLRTTPVRAPENSAAVPLDVAVAWARDEVTHGQLMRTLGVSSGAVYQKLAFAFREALRKGMVLK